MCAIEVKLGKLKEDTKKSIYDQSFGDVLSQLPNV